MARAFDPSQPVVVINARTRERHLVWAEIDSLAASPEDVTLLIRPGVNFDEGERYIVALRNLKGENGKTLAAPEGFRALPRPRPHDQPGRRGEARALRVALRHAGRGGHRPRLALPRVGLHRRERAQPLGARPHDPRRRVREARRHEPRRHEGRGRARPTFTIEEVTQNPEEQLALQGRGQVHGALLPQPAELRLGRDVHLPGGLAARAARDPPGQHDRGTLPVQHPEVRHHGGRVTAVALRARPARQPRRGEPGPAARLRPGAQLHLLRDRLGRDVLRGPSRHRREPRRDRRLPREGAARAAAQLRLRDRPDDPRGHVELPRARRPRAAGARQLPLLSGA